MDQITMTTEQIQHVNLFQPSQFKLTIERENYRHTEMFCKDFTHPSILGEAVDVPYKTITSVPSRPDSLSWGELNVNILLDEDFDSYREIYNWMLRHITTNNTSQYEAKIKDEIPSVSDIIVTILTNHNNRNFAFRYKDAFPTSLGEINFDASNTDEVTFPVAFRYVTYEFVN